ncbi:MAG: Ig-like domain-containing protein [Lachnospiraceae bacterium]|nr:Ig-like domain-containing protein [Lachnospiraceae bacterium]
MNFLEIEPLSEHAEHRIKQNLKFKTGKFVWRVQFTAPLNPSTVNNVNMFVTDAETNTVLRTAIRYNAETNAVEIEPLEPYTKNTAYILNVTKNVRSKGGQNLKEEIKIKFTV